MNQNLINQIKTKKSIAMLAPSFPVDFSYPEIIPMLKKIGFSSVTEITFGAHLVNQYYRSYIKAHSNQKYFISSSCPTIVSLINNKYPQLSQYLIQYDSPMIAMARYLKKQENNCPIYFISPCLAKKTIEAPKHPNLLEAVITFTEINQTFLEQNINKEDYTGNHSFDSKKEITTKIHPLSGGLSKSSNLIDLIDTNQIKICEGISQIQAELEQISSDTTKFRFFDFLNCEGGCISGPAIINKSLSIEEKQQKIYRYQQQG